MPTATPSLIARLRRRLAASAWLFAFVLAAKSVLAIGCAADGLVADTTSTTAAVFADASVAHDAEHDGAGFPAHDGHAGCHCSCAHSSTLPIAGSAWNLASAAAAQFPPISHLHLPADPRAELRPPIA